MPVKHYAVASLKEEQLREAHHKVSATTEHLSRNTTVSTEGVFGIQNITVEEKLKPTSVISYSI